MNFKIAIPYIYRNNMAFGDRNYTKILCFSSFVYLFKVLLLGACLSSLVYGHNKAEDYIKLSIHELFDNTLPFTCYGDNRSAICTASQYDAKDVILTNFRYTVDYKDSRTIERISSDIDLRGVDSSKKQFLPKYFECSDFTQIHNEKEQVNEQLSCSLISDTYVLRFRLRFASVSPLFKNKNTIELMKQGSTIINEISNHIGNAIDDKDVSSKTEAWLQDTVRLLSQIDVNLYGIDIAITKPNLPQKIYETLFADMIDEKDEMSSLQFGRYNQLSRTLYNSGVGYIYGNAIGYVWGNDSIDERTKQGLNSILIALRDSAMLDSNINTVSIKIVNRTAKHFNLGMVFEKIIAKIQHKNINTYFTQKESVGKAINVIDGSFLNRYRFEVETLKFR